MKLLAATSKEYAVFSVSHYDCRVAPDGTMMDGGQPGLPAYAGYNRSSGKLQWIEVANVDFAKIYNDYCKNYLHQDKRKYGVHKISKVRILTDDETPDTGSLDWRVENTVWGTNGKQGNLPTRYILLKNATDDHLQAIVDNYGYRLQGSVTLEVIEEIQRRRKNEKVG